MLARTLAPCPCRLHSTLATLDGCALAGETRRVTGPRHCTFARVVVAATVALSLLGCASRAPTAPPTALPSVPQPAVQARTDAAPPVPLSRLALPLELELAWLLPLVGQAVQKDLKLEQADWTRVTASGANPEVDTRMQAALGELGVSVGKGVVRIEVPVAYWGKVRARASTPFGSVWLTKGTEWGTREAPGQVILDVELRPRIDGAFELTTSSSLAGVRFQAPKGDKLCTTTLVRICISREDAAARVHAELEREIRKTAPKLLATVDARITERVDLRSFVGKALAGLAAPSGTEQLAVRVEELAVGPITGKGTRLRVNVELAFRVSSGGAAEKPPKLPPKAELRGISSELSYDFGVSFAELSARWSEQLAGSAVADWSIARCEVLGPAATEAEGAALLVALSLERHAQTLRVFARVVVEPQAAALQLTSVRLSAESSAALAALEVPPEGVESLLKERAARPLDAYAARQLAQVEQKLGALTLGLSPVALRLGHAEYQALGVAGHGLRFRVRTTAGPQP
jgi:hypothetical protein